MGQVIDFEGDPAPERGDRAAFEINHLPHGQR
jgi:hypothetical protein